jgi:1-deoxy-D-xylulose 5-phosphate reductoisomerase
MKMTRSDQDMKVQIVKEFETLVFSIINIPKKTMAAFKGANTITVKEFINSLIKSTDITSEIPTTLKTQSLKIIRKVIESENKAVTSSAMEWENEDFRPYKVQITDA